MKETVHVKGMHCRSCEILLEQELRKIKGVDQVNAVQKTGTLVVHSSKGYDKDALIKAVIEAGYEVGKEDLSLTKLSQKDVVDLVSASAILITVLIFLNKIGIGARISQGLSGSGLTTVFLVGLVAGLSTCMALVGGLILGVSARFAEKHPDASAEQKLKPHLFFNLGRIFSYFLLGGLIGAFGSFLQLSNGVVGLITVAVGIIMLFLGIRILEIFPRFNYGLSMPKFIGKVLGINNRQNKEYSHKNSFTLGALTFFLPCGFTQAMQVLAISSGSLVQGSLIMGMFSLGTAPGLLGMGSITAVATRKNHFLLKFVGLLVILLSFYNISNGLNIMGFRSWVSSLKTSSSSNQQSSGGQKGVTIITNTNVQLLKATYDPENYYQPILPDSFEVNVNQPVRLEIFAKGDGQGCMGSVMIPRLVNKPEFFVGGETVVFEFIAKKKGEYLITCAMGVIAGKINVK